MKVLKLENNIIINTEMWDALPENTDDYVYMAGIDNVGIGWEFRDSSWYNPNAVFQNTPVKVSLTGEILESIPEDSA